jgi:chromosome segregation ATPase
MIFVPFITAALLGVVIYYFLRSRKSLKKILLSQKNLSVIMDYNPKETEFSKRTLRTVGLKAVPATKIQNNVVEFNNAESAPEAIHTLKDSIIQQRNVLENLLNKVQEIEEKKAIDTQSQVDSEELKEKVELLEWKLKEKELEVQKLKNLEEGSKKTAEKLEEVHNEFDLLQAKIDQLEKQAGRSNTIEIELEKSKNEYEQLKKDIARKAEKIAELTAESQKKHQQLCETEDKLAKINRKLHNEMRRIGELESMLHMISEERDLLLQKSK